jgi:hypothetical protein
MLCFIHSFIICWWNFFFLSSYPFEIWLNLQVWKCSEIINLFVLYLFLLHQVTWGAYCEACVMPFYQRAKKRTQQHTWKSLMRLKLVITWIHPPPTFISCTLVLITEFMIIRLHHSLGPWFTSSSSSSSLSQEYKKWKCRCELL